MENKLEWKYIDGEYTAEHNGIKYSIISVRRTCGGYRFITRRVKQLYVTVNRVTDHVTGGQSTYKLKKLAEVDLIRRLTFFN